MQKENMVATLEALLASSGASPLCHCFFSLKDKTMETVFCFWNQFLKSFITKSLLGLCCCSAAAVVTARLQNKTLKHLHEFVTSVAAPSIISHCKNTHLHLCCWSIDHLAMDHLSLQKDPSPPLLLIYRSSLIARRPISPARYKKKHQLIISLLTSTTEQKWAAVCFLSSPRNPEMVSSLRNNWCKKAQCCLIHLLLPFPLNSTFIHSFPPADSCRTHHTSDSFSSSPSFCYSPTHCWLGFWWLFSSSSSSSSSAGGEEHSAATCAAESSRDLDLELQTRAWWVGEVQGFPILPFIQPLVGLLAAAWRLIPSCKRLCVWGCWFPTFGVRPFQKCI